MGIEWSMAAYKIAQYSQDPLAIASTTPYQVAPCDYKLSIYVYYKRVSNIINF